jgi:hypothetical protein
MEMARPTKTYVFNLTAVPTPTIKQPTNTPVPLSELDLEPIIFLPGDMPAEYEMGAFSKEFPGLIFFEKLTDFPKSDVVTSLDMEDTLSPNSITGYTKSRVSVILYDDLA